MGWGDILIGDGFPFGDNGCLRLCVVDRHTGVCSSQERCGRLAL